MNKLTAIKIKYNDGTYSDEIPVSVLAENVLLSGKSINLADALGNVRVAAAGNIQQQLDQLASKKIDMQLLDDYIANQLGDATTAWLDEHIGQIGTTIVLDNSLKISGAAADAKAVGDGINQAIQTIQNQMSDKVDNGYVEDGVAYFTSGDDILFSITGIGGGGGGGESSSSTLVLQNLTGWVSKTISLNSDCELVFNWSSVMDGYITGVGTAAVQVRGATVLTKSINQGRFSIDVKKYLQSGLNKVKVTVTDAYGNMKSIIFTIEAVSLVITSIFDESIVRTGAFDVLYTIAGTGDKNVHFIVDGVEVATDLVQTSGRQTSHTFEALSHGEHSLEIYATTAVDGSEVESNHLYFAVISVTEGNNTPIISSSYNNLTVKQFETVVIPYYVYNPASFTADIGIYVNNESYSSQTVDRSRQLISYRTKTSGNLNIQIRCGSVVRSFLITVGQADSALTPITEGLDLYLSAEGRSNNEANPGVWVYNTTTSDFQNFNFVSDGWVHDKEGNTVLRVTGNARLNINYLLFENNFTEKGKTIEFEFETSNVLNYDSEIITCWSNNKGLQITAQKALLKSDVTTINTQYKEDEHVRISFVISSNDTKLIYIYINGVLSGVTPYGNNQDFSQFNPVSISIGSSECTVDLYNIRVYTGALDSEDIITNWIADTQDVNEMLERYERNNIRDNGEISIDKLPINLPYFLIEGQELPQNKEDEKTISGRFVNSINPEMSFTYTNASCKIQGTSSVKYPRKNYKIKFSNFVNNNGETSSTYCLRGPEKSLPSKVFCFKADYASSEGANNVELVRLYEDLCPAKTQPQKNDPTGLIRQGIDGIPIVVFWYQPSTGITSFMGKYNFNFDKSSPVFGFQDGDESWETIDNSNDWAKFKRADYDTDEWLSAFEGRYPDKYKNATRLSQMAKWVCSTDPEQAPYDTREITEDNIVFHGGGHPGGSYDHTSYNTAPSTSAYSLMCVVKTPTYRFRRLTTEQQIANKSYFAPSIVFQNHGGTSFTSSSLNKTDPSPIRYTQTVCFDGDNKTLLAHSSSGAAFIQETNTTGRISAFNNSINLDLHHTFYFEIPFIQNDLDYYSVYWGEDSRAILPTGIEMGDIIYAGKNTPYYNLKNIHDSAKVDFETPVIYQEEVSKDEIIQYKFDFDSNDYRIAKFRYELENWFNKDDVLFYYLFTELFLMVDSRVKNSFPTKFGNSNWVWLPYDMDTAIGINNEGLIVFDYSLEDTDVLSDTSEVYNAADTVMWNNVRRAFPNELREMYRNLRSNSLFSYNSIENRFEAHQNVWSEMVFNEDAYYKYIQPFINNGENNLKMCLGSKAEQRKWWLYNRFRYIDSKYTAGDALSSYVQARVYHKADLTITPYAGIYASAGFDSTIVKAKAKRNQPVVITSPKNWDPNGSDAELTIYSADQLASLGDLSPFYIGYVSFAAATKLKQIRIGNGNPNYRNYNLNDLTLGNNTLLKLLDVRNCPNLNKAIDISGCTNIEEIYFDGTSITGLNLPNGGIISTLHLPGTLVNLTILNQKNITDFVLPDYSNLTTLRIENSSIDELPILLGMPDNGRVRLINVDWETTTLEESEAIILKLNKMRGIDQSGNNINTAQISGTLHATIVDEYQLELLRQWPNLRVFYDEVVQHNWLLYKYLNNTLTEYSDDEISTIAYFVFSKRDINNVNCPNVTVLKPYAFAQSNIMNLTSMPLITDIPHHCFWYGNIDNMPSFPNVTKMSIRQTFRHFSGQISMKETFPSLIEFYEDDLNLSTDYDETFDTANIIDIDLPNVIANISDGTIRRFVTTCPYLKYIYLPKFQINCNHSYFVCNCSNLEYIVAPLVTLGVSGLEVGRNPKLKFLDIFTAQEGVGRAGFWDRLDSLEHIVFRNPNSITPLYSPIGTSTPFSENHNLILHIYVPSHQLEDYQNASNWSVLYLNEKVIFQPLEEFTIDQTITGEFNYNLINLEVYHEFE